MANKIKVVTTYQKSSLIWFIFAGFMFLMISGIFTALIVGILESDINMNVFLFTLFLASIFLYLKGRKNFEYNESCKTKLDAEGEIIKASVTSKYQKANHYIIHYRFQDTFEVKVNVPKYIYEEISGSNEIEVEYLADNPQVSRLKEEEIF